MDSPPTRTTHSSWWRNPRVYLSALLALGIWPSIVLMPVIPGTYLDESWEEVLVYGRSLRWQFGQDLIYTMGPWSFLNSQFHLGSLETSERIVWETAGKLCFAGALMALTQRLDVWRQIAFALCIVLFHYLFIDGLFLTFFTLAVIGGLMDRNARTWQLIAWVAAIAFIGQFKFTYILVSFGGAATATALWITRRNWNHAFTVLAGFFLFQIAFWMAADQDVSNLVPFLVSSLEVAMGYGHAMAIEESLPVMRCGLGLLAACALLIFQISWKPKDRAFAWIGAAFLAGVVFMSWKHGYTRADGHVYSFLVFVVLIAFTVPGLFFPDKVVHWFELTPAIALLGVWHVEPVDFTMCREIAYDRCRRNMNDLLRVEHLQDDWDIALEEARIKFALPKVREAVKNDTVDVYNFHQGAALLNELNYKPRPIFQSYCAFTAHLADENLRFYQTDRAPEFLLVNFVTIDGRYPTIDDAPLLVELSRSYQPVLTEDEFLLLKKTKPLSPTRLARELVLETELSLHEPLEVPPIRDCAIWMQADLRFNLLGNLRAFLYRPPILTMVVTDDTGRETHWRMLTRVASDGFLLSPLLETQFDFAAFLRGRSRNGVRSVRFEAPPEQERYWGRFTVRVHALRELELEADEPYMALVDAGITPAAPQALVLSTPLEIFRLGAGNALFLHAPGELTLTVPSDAASFRGNFGLREKAYDENGNTTGVEFVVEAELADGRVETVWKRHLDPKTRVDDRGDQSFSIELGIERPARMRLRSLPGPDNDTSWDWAYCTKLEFAGASAK